MSHVREVRHIVETRADMERVNQSICKSKMDISACTDQLSRLSIRRMALRFHKRWLCLKLIQKWQEPIPLLVLILTQEFAEMQGQVPDQEKLGQKLLLVLCEELYELKQKLVQKALEQKVFEPRLRLMLKLDELKQKLEKSKTPMMLMLELKKLKRFLLLVRNLEQHGLMQELLSAVNQDRELTAMEKTQNEQKLELEQRLKLQLFLRDQLPLQLAHEQE